MGAVSVDVVNKGTEDVGALTREADVIMLGAGVPGLLQPDMVKEGAVILDAGTSETAGVVKGDADPSCAEKASLFTPSPGGIGPITVAMIFKNLLALKGLREEHGR
jgi:methylenetetrahydrofolate dehydrogenase (NADP+)/methenyltetrahydrofolate cyclohydrolase